jgi:hypothetical protein
MARPLTAASGRSEGCLPSPQAAVSSPSRPFGRASQSDRAATLGLVEALSTATGRIFSVLRQAMETRMANITGQSGSDTLTGGSNNHAPDGAASDDALPGGGGGDSLEGSADSDRLIGGHGDGQLAPTHRDSADLSKRPIETCSTGSRSDGTSRIGDTPMVSSTSTI